MHLGNDKMGCTCRVRQKPKMEIVLTKSAEFDAIVAEEIEPNSADSGDYGGDSLWCSTYYMQYLANAGA